MYHFNNHENEQPEIEELDERFEQMNFEQEGILQERSQNILKPSRHAQNQQQQPLGQKQSLKQSEDVSLVQLKNKLRTLFTFYSSFGDRINVNFLKSNNFHKMMLDAQLRDNQVAPLPAIKQQPLSP